MNATAHDALTICQGNSMTAFEQFEQHFSEYRQAHSAPEQVECLLRAVRVLLEDRDSVTDLVERALTAIEDHRAALDLDALVKQRIREALAVSKGNRRKAAGLLGIPERTLYRRIKELAA